MKLLFPVLFSLCLAACSLPADPEQEATNPYAALQNELLSGWNTWKNPSALSQVLMPEGLAINLYLRKTRRGPFWLRDAVFSNKPNVAERLSPGLHAWDGSYTDITFEWEGQRARLQTASEGNNLVMLYSPIESPEDPHILVFETAILWNKQGYLRAEGEQVKAHLPSQTLYIWPHSPENEEPLPLSAPYFSFWSDQEVVLSVGMDRDRDAALAFIQEKRADWEAYLASYGPWREAYEAMQTVHAWNTIYDAQNDRAITPVNRMWNEVWGGYVLFDWDTYFSALMIALDNKELAFSNAIAITDEATERGFIPNVATGFLKSYDRSQPPVGSLVCKLIYDRYPESWFLERVYPHLLSWNRWWDENRNNQGYLSWGSDPHPEGLEGHSKQAAKWESGLDNSPLFDEASYNEQTHMLELASVGLMSLYVADCQNLADMAEQLGHSGEATELRERGTRYSEKLRELWDEESGIYRDKYLDSGAFSPHLAPTNFYPLLAGLPTQKQAERMVQEHFFNPEEFYGEWIIPSIARQDPAFPENSYWRGRIWGPMNFLVYLGLRNYDLPAARQALAERSLELILKSWREERRVYENYNSTTGAGGDVRNSASFYSWGGLLAFIALMENDVWTEMQ